MPRYYFHLHDHVQARDEEGTELPDLGAARRYAIRCGRELIAEDVTLRGQLVLSHWIEVADEQGAQLLDVSIGDCVEVKP